MAGFISAERIEAGSIATSKLEPDAGNHLVISGNPSITQINNQIAPQFSTQTSYEAGDLVMKDGIVYVFVNDHPAGAWNNNDALATNVATQIELLPDKIIQYVGQQGYGKTFIQWTDPALDPTKNVSPGDYWIKQNPNSGTWREVKNKTWAAVKSGTWYDLMNKMPEMYCRKGTGQNAEWIPVNDTKAISEAYTRIEQTQFSIIQEAHRANAAEGELESKIIQTADGILQEVRQEVASGYISKTSVYQTADAIVTTAEQYTADRLTYYYTKTETASQISTSLSSYTYSKGDLYTKTNVYTKTETASQISTSLTSYTYSKGSLYTKSDVYTKTETASQISTSLGSYTYSKADVYTKTETASQISTSLSSYTYSKGNLYTKSDVYTKTETASQISTSLSSYTYSKGDLYTKSNVYTKTETASQISTSLSSYTYNKDDLYTKTETASMISTSISDSLGNYYTKTETASQISTYVGNNAYGKVSGIQIVANGIEISGSKYIKILSGTTAKMILNEDGIEMQTAGKFYLHAKDTSGSAIIFGTNSANATFSVGQTGEVVCRSLTVGNLSVNGNGLPRFVVSEQPPSGSNILWFKPSSQTEKTWVFRPNPRVIENGGGTIGYYQDYYCPYSADDYLTGNLFYGIKANLQFYSSMGYENHTFKARLQNGSNWIELGSVTQTVTQWSTIQLNTMISVAAANVMNVSGGSFTIRLETTAPSSKCMLLNEDILFKAKNTSSGGWSACTVFYAQ